MDEYLACTVATAGDVVGALAWDTVDVALLDGVGRILQSGSGSVSPDWTAKTTSWARSRALSLTIARLTWVRTVAGLSTSSAAISSLERPVATQATISRSRSVSRCSS